MRQHNSKYFAYNVGTFYNDQKLVFYYLIKRGHSFCIKYAFMTAKEVLKLVFARTFRKIFSSKFLTGLTKKIPVPIRQKGKALIKPEIM